jgi:hypothetical protein
MKINNNWRESLLAAIRQGENLKDALQAKAPSLLNDLDLLPVDEATKHFDSSLCEQMDGATKPAKPAVDEPRANRDAAIEQVSPKNGHSAPDAQQRVSWRSSRLQHESQRRERLLDQLSERIRSPRPPRSGARSHAGGETVLVRPRGVQAYYEWLYSPQGFATPVYEEMSRLAADGAYDFYVVAWPRGRVLYDTRKNEKTKRLKFNQG